MNVRVGSIRSLVRPLLAVLVVCYACLQVVAEDKEAESPEAKDEVKDILAEGPQLSANPGLLTEWLKLQKKGLISSGTWYYDETSILFGGLKPRYSRGQNLLDLAFLTDLETLCGIDGASVYLLFQSHRGVNAHTLAGDEQFFDNNDATPFHARGQLSELWWRQELFDGKARLKVGKIDANEDFAFVRNAADFLHGAFGNSPTIFLLPTYPDPATGADLLFTPDERLYAALGVFDGSLGRGIATGRRGPETFFGAPSTYFVISELGVNYALKEREGRIALGYWRNTGNFLVFDRLETQRVSFDGEEQELTQAHFRINHGTDGWYVVADQTFWRENPDQEDDKQGITGFYQFGSADPRITIFETYHGAGLIWTGVIPSRDDDAIGFGIAYSGLSSDPRAFSLRLFEIPVEKNPANEIAFQCYYKFQLNDALILQPNLTYVHDPGQRIGIPDVLAFTLRFVLAF